MSNKVLVVTWLALIALTLVSVALGHLSLSFGLLLGLVLAAVFVKNGLIVDVFMGLKKAPWGWRLAMQGYTLFVCLLIAASYALI